MVYVADMSRIHFAVATFLLGVAFGEHLGYWFVFIPLSFFCLFWVGFRNDKVILFLVMIALGVGRWHLDNWTLFSGKLDELALAGTHATFEGRIVSEPEVVRQKQRIVVEVSSFKIGENSSRLMSGKILLLLPEFPELFYGESIRFDGKLVTPKEYVRDGDPQQLYEDGIVAVILKPRVFSHEILNSGLDLFHVILQLKKALLQKVFELYGEPASSFIGGLQLGVRASIPKPILDDFRVLGLSHILAISGYNITLLIHIFAQLFTGFSRKVRSVCTITGILFFLLMTGMSASVIRAAIMGIVVVAGTLFGRKIRGIHSLLVCVFFMVLLQPRVLMHDLSFQLSVLATLSLLVVLPIIKKYLEKVPFGQGENLGVTVAAQVFTTPIMWYHFQMFSVISPVANVIFLPFIPFFMLLSFVTIVVGFVFPWLAQALSFIVEFLISFFLSSVHLLALLPGAAWQLPPLPWEVTVGFYFLVLVEVTFGRPKLGRYFSQGRVQLADEPANFR